MAVTAQKSTQVTSMTATPPVRLGTSEHHGVVRVAYFSCTQSGAGDAASTLDLVRIPAGKVRILKMSSKLICSAWGAARTLNVGHTGYTKPDNSAQAASAACIADTIDVSAAASKELGTGTGGLGTDPTLLIESTSGALIQAVVAGGTIPDGATLNGYVSYVMD